METPMQIAFNKIEEEFNIKIHPTAKRVFLEEEKRDIIEAHKSGIRTVRNDYSAGLVISQTSEQYYKNKFK